jgi:hypothetical protein
MKGRRRPSLGRVIVHGGDGVCDQRNNQRFVTTTSRYSFIAGTIKAQERTAVEGAPVHFRPFVLPRAIGSGDHEAPAEASVASRSEILWSRNHF